MFAIRFSRLRRRSWVDWNIVLLYFKEVMAVLVGPLPELVRCEAMSSRVRIAASIASFIYMQFLEMLCKLVKSTAVRVVSSLFRAPSSVALSTGRKWSANLQASLSTVLYSSSYTMLNSRNGSSIASRQLGFCRRRLNRSGRRRPVSPKHSSVVHCVLP